MTSAVGDGGRRAYDGARLWQVRAAHVVVQSANAVVYRASSTTVRSWYIRRPCIYVYLCASVCVWAGACWRVSARDGPECKKSGGGGWRLRVAAAEGTAVAGGRIILCTYNAAAAVRMRQRWRRRRRRSGGERRRFARTSALTPRGYNRYPTPLPQPSLRARAERPGTAPAYASHDGPVSMAFVEADERNGRAAREEAAASDKEKTGKEEWKEEEEMKRRMGRRKGKRRKTRWKSRKTMTMGRRSASAPIF